MSLPSDFHRRIDDHEFKRIKRLLKKENHSLQMTGCSRLNLITRKAEKIYRQKMKKELNTVLEKVLISERDTYLSITKEAHRIVNALTINDTHSTSFYRVKDKWSAKLKKIQIKRKEEEKLFETICRDNLQIQESCQQKMLKMEELISALEEAN